MTREPWLDLITTVALPAPDAGTGGDGGTVLPADGALRLGEWGGGAVVLESREERKEQFSPAFLTGLNWLFGASSGFPMYVAYFVGIKKRLGLGLIAQTIILAIVAGERDIPFGQVGGIAGSELQEKREEIGKARTAKCG